MKLDDYKTRYQNLQHSLQAGFLNSTSAVEGFVLARANGVDELLKDIWQGFEMPEQVSLIAVGGYGRSELHLYSDIDLLVLIPNNSHQIHQEKISQFLTFLWDVGLEVGHATRDIKDCARVIDDLSIVTNLLESRLLIGLESAFDKMKSVIKASDWSSQSFLLEKQKEQRARHANFSDTAYNLEPNIKESPGGLRDIQTVAWVAKWYFGVDTLFDLVAAKYLSNDEYELLKTSQLFLWRVRFALHIIAARREDRLAFQYQKQVANMLGYTDGDSMAVERFMKDYYQTVTKVARLNDILLQLLEDKVINTQYLNSQFRISYGYIHANHDQVFSQNPAAFIEVFLLIAKHSYIRGISAGTLRQMQDNLGLVDQNYYKKRNNNRLFIELLQQNKGVNKALKLMNRYGVLEHYIPAFGKIVGLMQYDLFHAFTVDQHTLFVIRNLRRFFIDEFSHEFSLCSEVAGEIKKPELLLLAGLFHDIAKGRGGDHAQLGMQDTQVFCRSHQLNIADTELVVGLVEKHLLMSSVAQKQDIDDPLIVKNFCDSVGSLEFLEYLYLLTVADIRATKDDLWNDWKDSLLRKLFRHAKHYLDSDTEVLLSHDQRIKKNKQALIEACIAQGFDMAFVQQTLEHLPKDYYLRYELDDMLWHLSLQLGNNSSPITISSKISESNVVDIFVLCDDFKGLFFNLVSVLERAGLDIVDAKILTTKDNKAYNTLSILQDKNLDGLNLHQLISEALSVPEVDVAKPKSHYSHRYFDNKTHISLSENKKWHLTKLEVNTLDKVGVLSNIAYVLYEMNISLINARVSTMGERVEDVFFVSNIDRKPLDKKQQSSLKMALEERL
ncbi:MAG: [protein-PII] uridylyltransferase [Candidatus Thioglobus sp.]|jgi:[protein-PII] uridylyltransferase|nr:[protein-PII] uridylyltransferase [Candidatus Thioglobus sp.]MBT4747674.1 [protein-PII] uridylyltransferase [Candidatus Thioglobus sp.]MBT6022742.1 [protein-PII] uridylyltransferase [Candidatus Thioglobus sp.]MBT6279237.1 [protein-PII] uridylyltransferase [Candidatus Thioglobus sp.]